MSRFYLFAVEDQGPRQLPVPPDATQFADLYQGLSLGVYDALRTFEHNKFLFLDRHLARTEKSMDLLGWSYQFNRPRLLRTLHDIVSTSSWPEMRVRIDVLAEPAEALGSTSRELIAIQPFSPPPQELYEIGVAVDFASGVSRNNPLAKTADFAAKRPATSGLKLLEHAGGPDGEKTQEAQPPSDRKTLEPYEYLLLSSSGQILEGTGTNFWAVRDGVLYTAGEGVLEGVTREIILQLVVVLQIPLKLEAIRVEDIPAIQEAALSGSSRAFLPVIAIAGQPVGDGRPGPVSRRILDAYNHFIAANLKSAIQYVES